MEQPSCVRLHHLAPAIGAQEDLTKGDLGVLSVDVGVRLEPGLELGLGRWECLRGVLHEKLELLPEAPPNDGVLAVETHRSGLTRGHLLADVVVDEALQLLLRGWTPPGPGKARGQVLHLAGADHDPTRVRPGRPARPAEEKEEGGAEKQEVGEGLAQERSQSVVEHALDQGARRGRTRSAGRPTEPTARQSIPSRERRSLPASRYNGQVKAGTTGEGLAFRKTWPVRLYRLGEEPGDDQTGLNSPEERLAMMWDLAVDAWSLSGRPIPDYSRHETPVSCRAWSVDDDAGP
jgi:hypothetical protein